MMLAMSTANAGVFVPTARMPLSMVQRALTCKLAVRVLPVRQINSAAKCEGALKSQALDHP